ncbi:MAG: hypothetical protein HY930_06750 [Euryarchaeota archaeon]|nr:hypothetical protein [Euryarchaeota archaeon]
MRLLIVLLLSFSAAAADSALVEKIDQLIEKFNEPYAGVIRSFSAEFGDVHHLRLYEKVSFLDRLRGKEGKEYWYIATIDANGRVKITEAGTAEEYYSMSLDDFDEVYATVMEKGAMTKSDAIKLALKVKVEPKMQWIRILRWLLSL